MPNIVQKWIYNLSAGAPLLIVFAIVWYCEKEDMDCIDYLHLLRPFC